MSYKSKVSFVLCLLLLVCCMSLSYAATTATRKAVWTKASPLTGGNVYYGYHNPVDNNYYLGHSAAGSATVYWGGALEYDRAGNLLNSVQFAYDNPNEAENAAKSAVRIGDSIYLGYSVVSNHNLIQLDANDWTAPHSHLALGGNQPESITTDGTNIYSNAYDGAGKSPVTKYSTSGSVIWAVSIPTPGRIRGLSYYSGTDVVYVADGNNGNIWEINAVAGTLTSSLPIITVPGMTGAAFKTLYQVVRSGSKIYAVTDNGDLYTYVLSGGSWSLASTEALQDADGNSIAPGVQGGFGIGINNAGSGIWVSGGNTKVSYFVLEGSEARAKLNLGPAFTGTGDPTTVSVLIELADEFGAVRNVTTKLDADTTFSIPDVEAGFYTVAIKPSHWLKYLVKDPDTGEALLLQKTNGLNDYGELGWEFINGDCDGDNEITAIDYNIVLGAFGALEGDSNWDARADIDGDGEITAIDYNVMLNNFGQLGD